jgi:integrase
VLRADALDAVRITRWLRVEADDHELAALDLGHHHKVPASQFARVYGFAPQKGQNNRQGVRDRRDRLRAALDHGVRDEKILRRDRLRAEADAAWATQHDDELRALAAALLDPAAYGLERPPVPLTAVQDLLGHADPATTARYTRASPAALARLMGEPDPLDPDDWR